MIAALVVMVGALSAPIEHLLPDAHDADASGRSGTAIAGGGSGTGVTSLHHASEPAGDQRDVPPQGPVHSTHVDHCAHAHVLALDAQARAYTAATPARDPFDLTSQRPVSISLAPDLRPPIA